MRFLSLKRRPPPRTLLRRDNLRVFRFFDHHFAFPMGLDQGGATTFIGRFGGTRSSVAAGWDGWTCRHRTPIDDGSGSDLSCRSGNQRTARRKGLSLKSSCDALDSTRSARSGDVDTARRKKLVRLNLGCNHQRPPCNPVDASLDLPSLYLAKNRQGYRHQRHEQQFFHRWIRLRTDSQA